MLNRHSSDPTAGAIALVRQVLDESRRVLSDAQLTPIIDAVTQDLRDQAVKPEVTRGFLTHVFHPRRRRYDVTW